MKGRFIGPYISALYVLGFIIILDGFGSIILYLDQPWFPDHTVRIIRMLIGGAVICIGEKLRRY